MNEKKKKNNIDIEHTRKKMRSILLLNGVIITVMIISTYLAFYGMTSDQQLRIIFICGLFSCVSNGTIWIVSIYMYGLGLDTKEYFKKNANLLDTALGEVGDFTETLKSENVNTMKKLMVDVDWKKIEKMYYEWVEDDGSDDSYSPVLDSLLQKKSDEMIK